MSELQWSINADGSQSVTVPFRGLTVRVPLGTAAALGGGSPFAEYAKECERIHPEIEMLKEIVGHQACDGWSMSGEPRVARCGCGVPIRTLIEQAKAAAR